MANKKQVNNSNKKNTPALSGHNIYKDKHGQTIYFNKRTRVGYVVPEKDFSKFQILQMRYILALVIAVLLYKYQLLADWYRFSCCSNRYGSYPAGKGTAQLYSVSEF